MTRPLIVASLLLALGACSDGAPAGETQNTAQSLQCDGYVGAVFTVADLGAPSGAEAGKDPAAAAVRALLDSQAGRAVPEGFRTLMRTPDRVLFAADTTTSPYAVDVVRSGGAWRVASHGPCAMRRARPGSTTTTWTPAAEVAPGATTFTANVRAETCSNGRSPADRIMQPAVEESADRVTITFFLSPLQAGAYDCQAAPSAPFEVTLRSPLGSRRLYDGGPYPPQPVSATDG